jgi:predicted ATPase
VGGEFRYPIPGMLYPDLGTLALGRGDHVQRAADAVQVTSQYSAIKLFLQGARRARPGFELTDENLSGVIQICHLVEGMPLAIRLAAPWVAVLSTEEIASELARSLDLLATDRRDVPARQRSVRATFDHTWRP